MNEPAWLHDLDDEHLVPDHNHPFDGVVARGLCPCCDALHDYWSKLATTLGIA